MSLFAPLLAALNEGRVRYVVVGGLATVLHGHPRLTADVDLIVDLDSAEALRAMEVFRSLGLRPRAPVDILDFAKPDRRKTWVEEKGMRVFTLHDPAQPMREVDVFVESPIPFEELWRGSTVMDLGGTTVRVVSIPHLIRLKRMASRPQDLLDIEALEEILRRKGSA